MNREYTKTKEVAITGDRGYVCQDLVSGCGVRSSSAGNLDPPHSIALFGLRSCF